MDKLILAEKLEALRHCVQRVVARRPDSVEALQGDVDSQDILALNLDPCRADLRGCGGHRGGGFRPAGATDHGAGIRCAGTQGVIDDDLARRMRAAVGFRNIAVHNYQAVDWNIVFVISHRGLADFKAFAQALSALL